MTHIVFVDSICDPKRPGQGGISDLTWRLASELARAGDVVTVVGAYEQEVAAPYPNVRLVIAPSAVVHRNNVAKHALRAMRLARVAKDAGHADVYHVSDTVVAGAFALAGLGSRTIWQAHMNVYYQCQHGITGDRSMHELMRLATRLASKKVSRVVALGPSLIPWWQRSGFPRERICVVPNGIDVPVRPSKSGQWILPRVWQDCAHRLLYVGRLSAEKGGYFELIEAIEALNRSMSVGLLFVGEGPLRAQVEGVIRDCNLGTVIACTGHQPPDFVQRAYAHADLVVLPSRSEMMPRVMLEAWAAGVPFMASAVGAIGDYVINNQTGFILERTDPDNIKSRVQEVLERPDLRKRVVERASEEVKKFVWPEIAQRYRHLYASIMAQKCNGNG